MFAGGKCVKKSLSRFALLAMIVLVVLSASSMVRPAKAQAQYIIDSVHHTVQVLYNGYVFINDTIRLNVTGEAPSDFLIGFPEKYGVQLVKCFAFNESSSFPVTLDVPLNDRVGFYAVKVDFPSGTPHFFSVGFVLSNNLLTLVNENVSAFLLDFPAHPSLTKPVSVFNGSIVLPLGAQYDNGTTGGFTYSQVNLPEFAYSPANISYLLVGEQTQIFDVVSLNREIRVDEFGNIAGSDVYVIENKRSKDMSSINIFLPLNASNPVAEDQFGIKAGSLTQIDPATNRYGVGLTRQIANGQTTSFTIKYDLPNDLLAQVSTNNFGFNMSLFRQVDYLINDASVVIVLPEGGSFVELQSGLTGGVYGVDRSVFQESLTLNRQNIIALDDLSIDVTYAYTPLWLSFRPTMWVWAAAIVGSVIVFLALRRPKVSVQVGAPTGTLKVKPETLKSFSDAYEERMKIESELETLEARVQKGKIPRRRYKVRRRMLESRLATLARTSDEFKERARATGGKYADLMRQLEISETEINEAAANIKSIEARYNRGELSLEAYRKLLGDYEHRKEDAENAINGILLRLREETR